jgi:hypothetical protein
LLTHALFLPITLLPPPLAPFRRLCGPRSAQDEKEHYFGRIFGIAALVRTGQVPTAGPAVATDMVRLLLATAQKKAFLKEICYEVLAHLLDAFATDKSKAAA